MRESSNKPAPSRHYVQGTHDEIVDCSSINGRGVGNQQRSLSNGSNDSTRFKFLNSVNRMPLFTLNQLPKTGQNSVVNKAFVDKKFVVNRTSHISRQSLSREASSGKYTCQGQIPAQTSSQSPSRLPSNNDGSSQAGKNRAKSRPSSMSNQQKQGQNKAHHPSTAVKSGNSKYIITMSTKESPQIKESIKQSMPEKRIQKADIQSQDLNFKIKKRLSDVDSQPMVILENTHPDQISQTDQTAIKSSDWQRLINQQYNHPLKHTLINNLVGSNNGSGNLLLVEQNSKEPTARTQVGANHIKNKLSAQSESVQRQGAYLKSSQQILKSALAENGHIILTSQQLELQKPTHKKVKSDIPVSKKTNMTNFQPIKVITEKLTEATQKVQSIGMDHRQNKLQKAKQNDNNFIRDRLEADTQENRKQLNISVENLLFDENEQQQTIQEKSQEGKPVKKVSEKQSLKAPVQQLSKPDLQIIEKQKLGKQKAVVTHQRLKSDVPIYNQPFQMNIMTDESEQLQLVHKNQATKQSDYLEKSKVLLTQNNSSQVQKTNKNVKPQIFRPSEIFNAPQNSVNLSQIVSPRDNNDWKIETQESISSSVPPQEKLQLKLIHHIKRSFQQNGECPPTTVEFYRVGKVLGKGAFGKVNIATQLVAQQLVAIKSINTTHFSEESQSKKVMQEVMILKQTRHKNIVRLYEYFQTQRHVLIVIEFSSGGDLLSYVRKRRQLKEEVAKSVFKQIIEAIQYCHSKRILHRDIKLDNILLNIDGGVKICDFGVSKIVKPGEKMMEQCGTPAYIAPEILIDKGYEGFAVDIWSAGVVLYAMLYGTVPFKANNMTELQKMIIKGNYTLQEGISSDAKNLLKGLLETDPLLRLPIDGILAHPWMRDAKNMVDLFTNAEKNYMISQITSSQDPQHSQLMNPNGNDFFSDKMMESDGDSMKNAETKSIILAPFNSTRSNLQEIEKHYSLPEEIKEMIQSKSCLKFAHRVREIDKQYEVNNNAELDNGVYHDFNKDVQKEDSLQSDFRETINSQKDQAQQPQDAQVQKLKKMMLEAGNQISMNGGLGDTSEQQQNKFEKQHQQAKEEQVEQIDDEVISEAGNMGYDCDALRRYLQQNELNNATTTYFLLQSKKQSNLLDTTHVKKSN